MKFILLVTLSTALAAALPAPAIPCPSSLPFPTTFSTSVLPVPSAGGGAGIMVDNMAPGGGGLPPGGIGKRGVDIDKDSTINDVYTSGRHGDNKLDDGDSWADKGFAGGLFKGDDDDKSKDKDDDNSKPKDDDKSKSKDDKSSGDSTFDNNRPDNKNDKPSMDKSIPNLPSGIEQPVDKPATSAGSTPEMNNSATFFKPAPENEKDIEELALVLDAANANNV